MDDPDRRHIEALVVEWVSWLTKAAREWDMQAIVEKFPPSAARGCAWVGFNYNHTTGVLAVEFGVPAEQIRRDVPEADVNYIAELTNTEPGREIGARIEQKNGYEVVVLQRFYYIPSDQRSEWYKGMSIPEGEREFIVQMLDDALENDPGLEEFDADLRYDPGFRRHVMASMRGLRILRSDHLSFYAPK